MQNIFVASLTCKGLDQSKEELQDLNDSRGMTFDIHFYSFGFMTRQCAQIIDYYGGSILILIVWHG